jgi:serine/threonine-protein kinase
MHEAQAAAKLRSPHVVQILDYGVDEASKLPFIVMELLEGETLAQRIKRLGRLTAADTARILSHVGRAVGRAHEANIVHRDLKPENVFLVHNEDEEIAKVLDFGVAKVSPGALGTAGSHTRTGSIMGTPYYMSPEQAQGNKAVDDRSDLWSLGVIAFECMTGVRPFYSEGLGDLVLQICIRDLPVPSHFAPVPAGFDAWFAKAVAREPDQRFQSAKELTDALSEALGIEAREASNTISEPTSFVPSQRAEANTKRGLGASLPNALEDADGNAATVALVPQELPARSVRIGDHIVPMDDHSGGGLRIIFGVAAVALTAGLVIGFLFLRYRAQADDRELPAPAARAERSLERTSAKVRPSAETLQPAAVPSASADATAATDGGIRDAGADAAAKDAGVSTPDAATPRASTADAAVKRERPSEPVPADPPDGGWVKPEWAIPDDEPIRRPVPPEYE